MFHINSSEEHLPPPALTYAVNTAM
jgi:hypothetical protein